MLLPSAHDNRGLSFKGILSKGATALIEVKHLTKRYGSHAAVSDLSFSIEKGGVYGFLGPNGAGKSTTMNIVTGCLGATQGDVLLGGHNILEEPRAAKQLIGYLPELPPLYADMTPQEYLRFVLRAKGVPRSAWARELSAVMDRTRIGDVRDRLIGNLSKGYRQRVGIAQALLGNPQAVILDEPTAGLDPAQIIEIRELIRELGCGHTVLLSSHILTEVQAVCDHIMILSHGRLVASDTADNLTRLFAGRTTLRLLIKAPREEVRGVLDALDGVEAADFGPDDPAEGTRVDITPRDDLDLREALFMRFAGASMPILEMVRERASLEDVFLELTQDAPASGAQAGANAEGKEEAQA